MSDDTASAEPNADANPTALQRATIAVRDLADAEPFAPPHRVAEAAIAASATRYVPPERPVDVTVTISDDDGVQVEQTVNLSREEAADIAGLAEVVISTAVHVAQAFRRRPFGLMRAALDVEMARRGGARSDYTEAWAAVANLVNADMTRRELVIDRVRLLAEAAKGPTS